MEKIDRFIIILIWLIISVSIYLMIEYFGKAILTLILSILTIFSALLAIYVFINK